uniref:Uncharacterized protein n=1 Tax=Auxenochlorella protothecoides TaxID=3075 RepID=A0A1D2AHD8_AUXPR
MPLARSRNQQSAYFAISPWQSRRHTAALPSGDHTVAEEALLAPAPAAGPLGEETCPPPPEKRSNPAAPLVVNWKRRCVGGDPQDPLPVTEQGAGPPAQLVPSSLDPGRHDDVLLPPSSLQPGSLRLEGTAHLAFHPDGRLSGHILHPTPAGGWGSMGLMGRRLTSYRECTRDAEWQLYLLTLVTNMGDLEAIAECTSGDAACLRAPAELECMELAELGRSLPDLKPSRQWLGLDFTCTTLLLDAEAQRHLARLRVGSWGEGAWCCIGPAAVTLCQDRGRGRPEIPEGQAPGVPLAAGWRVVLDDEEAW